MIKQLTAVPMIEYAIFIVMVIVTIGFAWLWLIEQPKKRKRALRKKEKASAVELAMSHVGTFETCRTTLSISVYRGRPEVVDRLPREATSPVAGPN